MRVLATHFIRQFPLHFPSRASPCATRFRTSSNTHCFCTVTMVERMRLDVTLYVFCLPCSIWILNVSRFNVLAASTGWKPPSSTVCLFLNHPPACLRSETHRMQLNITMLVSVDLWKVIMYMHTHCSIPRLMQVYHKRKRQ